VEYLTFTTIHTMIIISLCGIVYLGRQCFIFIHWITKGVWKELEEDKD
jgi:hypothetical protein